MLSFNTVTARADGILGGISWGNSTKGVISLPDYTVLRLGFEVREYGSYRDEGYLYRYPSMYGGYSIIVGTCDGVSRCILSPTSDGTGTIDYHDAGNMYRSYSDCSDGLSKAVYKMTMGGTSKYNGAGVSALSSSPPIYISQYLDASLMSELSSYTGGDSDSWNTAAFKEVPDTEWIKTKDTSEVIKQNAMAMTILAMYLKHIGSSVDPQQVYKYNVHNSMRAGTVYDWVASCGSGTFNSLTADSISVKETGNPNGVSQTDAQLFNQWFKKGLAGNRIALSSYFYREQMLNYDMDESTRNIVGNPDNLWFTPQYRKSSSSRAENFSEYKTGFAVFKAPPISSQLTKADGSKAVGSHTLNAEPESQKVPRFSQLSADGKEVVTKITLTPSADGLNSLTDTVFNLLTYDNCIVNEADGSITIPDNAEITSYENEMFQYSNTYPMADKEISDRAVVFNSAEWSIEASGEGMDEPGSSDGTVSGICSVNGSYGNGKAQKQTLSGINIKRSEIYSSNEEAMKEKIKDSLRNQLVNYDLGEIKSYDGHFENAGSFTWKFSSAVDVNCSVMDFCQARIYVKYGGNEYSSGSLFSRDNITIDDITYYSGLTNSEQRDEVYYYYDSQHCFIPFYTGWIRKKLNTDSTSFNVNFRNSNATATIIVENVVSEKLRWQNQPVAFAEIKDGTYSDARQTESYEAMQGIPTSRTMYANIGGTPFYIDIICELKTVDFNKDFTYKHTRHGHKTVDGSKVCCDYVTTEYTQTPSAAVRYIVVDNITLRPCTTAHITSASSGGIALFAGGGSIDVPFMDGLTAELNITGGDYFIDDYGNDSSSYCYGFTSDGFQGSYSADCDGKPSSSDVWNDIQENVKVFVNSPGVSLTVKKPDGSIIQTLNILEPYSFETTLSNKGAGELKSVDKSFFIPEKESWDKEEYVTKLGYTGQPDIAGRNNGDYSYAPIQLNETAHNGLYTFPVKLSNPDYNETISQGYEADESVYANYIELGEAQEYGPGLCINNNSVPEKSPVPLNYVNRNLEKYSSEQDGINPVIVHNPISIQDVSIGTSKLAEQRIGYKNPEGREGSTTRIDIDDYFYLYTPIDGSLVRNYANENTNAGSTNKNISDCLSRGILVSEMYDVKQSGDSAFTAAKQGAAGKGYNGITADVSPIIPKTNGIRASGGSYMDTSHWVKCKFVQFPFDVVMNNSEYVKGGTWIQIPKNNTATMFAVSGNQIDVKEAVVKFAAAADNAPDIGSYTNVNFDISEPVSIIDEQTKGLIDNAYSSADSTVNFARNNNMEANHYVKNTFTVDVVGRIGNFTLDYCEDPAISYNFADKYMRTKYNMYSKSDGVLNIAGTLPTHAMSKSIGILPLKSLPSKDGTKAVPKLGYGINYSIQTIGDYGGNGKKLTIIPSYKIDGKDVTSIKYSNTSMSLENIYDVGTNPVSYNLQNSVNSEKAKLNSVLPGVYSLGDVIRWENDIPAGIKHTESGEINIDADTNTVLIGTPSHIELPVNLKTDIGYTARSDFSQEMPAFKITKGIANNNNDIKPFNTNHNRWFGAFSLPSSSKFYIENNKESVVPFGKTVLVNFDISTDICSAGWALYDTSGISGGTSDEDDENNRRIPVVEFDIGETSADDMTTVGTH